MKNYNTTVENESGTHCFSFKAESILNAIQRLENLKLTVVSITELNDNFKGTLRNPEEMYN